MPGQFADAYAGNQKVQTAWGQGEVFSTPVNVSANGNNTAIAASAGKRIVPLAGDLIATGAVTVTVQSSGGAVLDGPFAFPATGGKIYAQVDWGHFATGLGEALVINLGGSVQVGGHLLYALVG